MSCRSSMCDCKLNRLDVEVKLYKRVKVLEEKLAERDKSLIAALDLLKTDEWKDGLHSSMLSEAVEIVSEKYKNIYKDVEQIKSNLHRFDNEWYGFPKPFLSKNLNNQLKD